jgi:hypothetical protein
MAVGVEAQVEVVRGCVRVRGLSGCDARRARALLMAVDQAIARSGVRRVLLDRRDAPELCEEVEAIFRHWVESARSFERVGVVGLGHMERVGTNMRALARKLEVRAFEGVDEAENWLVRGG